MDKYDFEAEPLESLVCVKCYGFTHYPDESSNPEHYREAAKYMDFGDEPEEHFHRGGYAWCSLCETTLGGSYFHAHEYPLK